MKSLLTKRRGFLIIVRVYLKEGRKLSVPVPLWVVEESLQAVSSLAWLAQKFLGVWAKPSSQSAGHRWTAYAARIPVGAALDVVNDMLRELRGLGRFRLVEVEGKDFQVYIDLY